MSNQLRLMRLSTQLLKIKKKLVKKYGLEKPSETAKLRSIRVIDTPSEMEQKQQNEHKNKALAFGGYRFEKDSSKNVDGSDEIARQKYFCNKKVRFFQGRNRFISK
ncbi:hypothetical protein [Brevibacillus laterosporus]|uniref:hypothetical protein n=1 Tax=Brevibacillus laterosporus TaxID=1465 RepID=UPI00265D2936|nr:hypothetical protein [Brevibacillus laterosporus]